jgi:hypothetical protein
MASKDKDRDADEVEEFSTGEKNKPRLTLSNNALNHKQILSQSLDCKNDSSFYQLVSRLDRILQKMKLEEPPSINQTPRRIIIEVDNLLNTKVENQGSEDASKSAEIKLF